MIKVAKTKRDFPAILNSLGQAEATLNLNAVKTGKYAQMKFKIYKHPDVETALLKVFKNKCAYCEAKTSYAAPWDFEHFRPKSKTIPKGTKRGKYFGYYWLASDWNNLLLSCINCNRPKRHYVPGQVNRITIGKHEQFPLDDDTLRWTSPKSKIGYTVEEKVRLLVHPCKEYPESYFFYITSGPDLGNIKPKSGIKGLKLRKAEQSIVTYALHRMDLVNARANLISEINRKILVIEREITRYGSLQKAVDRTESNRFIQEYLTELLTFTNPDQQFSAVAKQIIKPFLLKIKPSLARIKKKK
jgi:uncharacterized protein (TIGR02646 family)